MPTPPTLSQKPLIRHAWIAMLTVSAACVHAGRPLSTEDAGAEPPGQCHIEAWIDSDTLGRARHISPACGVLEGLELAIEKVQVSPADTLPQGQGIALKWAPDWLSVGSLNAGLKVGVNEEKAPGASGWRRSSSDIMGVATYTFTPRWAAHLNIARHADKLAGTATNTYAAALVWSAHERWQLHAEVLGERRGPATLQAGVRYWALPDEWAIDATAGRTNATTDSRTWGLGVGWYGIKF